VPPGLLAAAAGAGAEAGAGAAAAGDGDGDAPAAGEAAAAGDADAAAVDGEATDAGTWVGGGAWVAGAAGFWVGVAGALGAQAANRAAPLVTMASRKNSRRLRASRRLLDPDSIFTDADPSWSDRDIAAAISRQPQHRSLRPSETGSWYGLAGCQTTTRISVRISVSG
ncbi:MAG: hypothetical protein AB7K36_22185, partial [Chloroflexota bacterium]